MIPATASMVTATTDVAGAYDHGLFMNFDFSGGNERVTTLPAEKDWNSFTWSGSGAVAALGSFEQKSDSLTTELSAALGAGPGNPGRIDAVLQESRRRRFRWWMVAIDSSDGSVVADPVAMPTRWMVPGRIMGGATLTAEVGLESIFNQMRVRAARTMSNAEQQLIDATDDSFISVGRLPRSTAKRYTRKLRSGLAE